MGKIQGILKRFRADQAALLLIGRFRKCQGLSVDWATSVAALKVRFVPLLTLESPWELTMKKLLSVLCVLAIVFSPISMAAANPIDLAGTEWGFAGDTGKSARFVQFRSEGKLGGYSGCNRFTGTYVQNGNALTMGPLATTRMACPPQIMKREQEFLDLLGKIRHVDRTHLQLILKDGDGNVLAELIRWIWTRNSA
jgi:heat shock protein HslJ